MNTYKILIADDDQDHLLMLACMLRQAGYEVISAFDAKHALQLVAEQAPDLLLLDIHMGDEDGFAVQERLQQIEELAVIPVIYISGDQSNWAKSITNAIGAHAMISKPFTRDDLLTIVKTVLNKTPRHTAMSKVKPMEMITTSNKPAEAFLG